MFYYDEYYFAMLFEDFDNNFIFSLISFHIKMFALKFSFLKIFKDFIYIEVN